MNNNLKVPKIYNPSCKLMPVRNLVIMNDAYPHPCKPVIIISVIYSRYAFPTVTNSKQNAYISPMKYSLIKLL